ncbi:PucR family transcriptional regulator [Nocardioides limicola]|uniref:PucR family transcriptional regulator n=1 Tax=Nocardioides limicola TaxID=2803368 RepID=UPI00193C5DF2|nr:helix-turn-helix domain-containing protein [Nocardioides sp. DJM-14]
MRPELQDIVDDVSRLLAQPVTLEDRNFHLIAFHAHGAPVDEVRQQSILSRRSSTQVRDWFESFGIATATGPVRIPADPEHRVLARLCLPARWREVTYGYLWVVDEEAGIDEAVIPAAMAMAERAGALMAQQARAREDLGFRLQDLLSADRDTVEAAADEIDARDLVRRGTPVAAVELRMLRRPASGPVPMNLWTLPRSVLAWVGEDHTTLMVPLEHGDLAAARELAHRARDLYLERLGSAAGQDLVAGIGAVCTDPAQLRSSWQQARLAARVLESVPRLRPVAAWPDLGVYRLLACGPESALAGAVLDESVRRLLAHPDPDLRESVLTYLNHGGSVQETAAALNVHRQTVYHRLHRVQKVTGLDLDRGEHRLMLHLGLTLAPLLSGVVQTSD